ncbi:MAG: hypothetical protein SGI92_03280 [Bryobacteraceae bacterium]|nr:hypothetical protein [Bryobacteraceae bacterium]
MTQLLQKAFEAAGKLSPEAQDALARAPLFELESEKAWDTAFPTAAADGLVVLADEALSEHCSRKTRPLDPNDL